MEKDLELLSIGDVSLDLFISPSESESLCSLDDKRCLICFSYGEKIPVESLEFSLGGNAANNAVGTRRLGVNVGLVSTLGADLIGDQILAKLETELVNLDYVVQQPSTDSNYSVVINYGGERTIFSYHAPRSYEFPVKMPVTPWIYLTSMGEAFQPFYNYLVDFITENQAKIKLAFNPGSRQLRAPIQTIEPILKKTYLLYVNREEAERMTNFKDSQNKEKELLENVCLLGPQVAVVTDGANGAYLFDKNNSKFLKIGVFPVDAYERTGAGDAFGAGCLAALIKGKSFQEALIWGTVNSASVIGYVGSQRGLLRENEMPFWIERAMSAGVKPVEF